MNTEQSKAAWIAERKSLQDRRRARAADNLSGHVYTQLTAGNGVEVWRCKAPRSTFYAFDIMMTRFGIAVVGDIDNMTFTVGSSYGMEFLAGKDIEYYIHSKLDAKCKDVEFDRDGWREQVVQCAISRIREISNDDELEKWPAWVEDHDQQSADILSEVVAFAWAMKEAEQDTTWWDDLHSQLSEAEDIEYTEAAMTFASEYGETMHMCDLEQSSIEKTCESVFGKLYMINHAAKAIMAMKALASNVGAPVDE